MWSGERVLDYPGELNVITGCLLVEEGGKRRRMREMAACVDFIPALLPSKMEEWGHEPESLSGI